MPGGCMAINLLLLAAIVAVLARAVPKEISGLAEPLITYFKADNAATGECLKTVQGKPRSVEIRHRLIWSFKKPPALPEVVHWPAAAAAALVSKSPALTMTSFFGSKYFCRAAWTCAGVRASMRLSKSASYSMVRPKCRKFDNIPATATSLERPT